MSWRTTAEADEDLGSIGEYGAETYGTHAVDLYLDGLRSLFDLLAVHPYMARERAELANPVRLHRYRAHNVFYSVVDEDILLIRVLGVRQDWQSLFD